MDLTSCFQSLCGGRLTVSSCSFRPDIQMQIDPYCQVRMRNQTCIHSKELDIFPGNQSTQPPCFFLFSSEVPTWNTDPILCQNPCVAARLKMSRYHFNGSLFLRLVYACSSATDAGSDLHTFTWFLYIFTCHWFLFPSAKFCYFSSGINYDTGIKWCCLFIAM